MTELEQVPATQPQRSLLVARLIQAVWLGGGVFLAFLAAPAAFRAAGDPTAAANVVGAMLSRWHYLALLAPALLLMIEWRRARQRVILLLFIAILAAGAEVAVDLRIRAIRNDSPVAISSLPKSDPLRRHFGLLHGFSSLLLMMQIVGAIGTVVVEPDSE